MPSEQKPQYRPQSTREKLGYLIEESGEVLAAAGKSIRWGLTSVNPELPMEQQETNAAWLSRELLDLERAISLVRADQEFIWAQQARSKVPPRTDKTEDPR